MHGLYFSGDFWNHFIWILDVIKCRIFFKAWSKIINLNFESLGFFEDFKASIENNVDNDTDKSNNKLIQWARRYSWKVIIYSCSSSTIELYAHNDENCRHLGARYYCEKAASPEHRHVWKRSLSPNHLEKRHSLTSLNQGRFVDFCRHVVFCFLFDKVWNLFQFFLWNLWKHCILRIVRHFEFFYLGNKWFLNWHLISNSLYIRWIKLYNAWLRNYLK